MGACVVETPRRFGPLLRQEDRTMAELDADARKRIPKSKFAEPDKRKYPIEDKPHARNAKARASQAVKAGRMSKAEAGSVSVCEIVAVDKHGADRRAGLSSGNEAVTPQGPR
jgi:hypothetical protein